MKYSTPRAFKWMLSIVFALLFSNFGFGTTNTTFYSVCTGTQSLDLNTLTNWNTSRTGGGAAPVAASDFTNTGNVFVIQGTGGGTGSPHTITLTAAWTVAGLTIEAGATLNTGAFTLTINNGTAAIDLDIFGTLVVGKNISLAGTLQVEATGVYTHSFNTATVTIPTATWVAGSTCSVTAIVAGGTTMSGFNQTFSNLTFNCPGLTNTTLTISNLTSATTFNVGSLNTGSIFVTSTGTIGTLNESNATGTANFISCAITNYNMTGAGSSTLKSCTIGTYLQSAGTVTQNTTGNNITGNFTFNGGSFVHASLPVTFSGSSPQTISGTSPITFYDLNISSSGSTVSSTNAITTANSLNVNSGTYSPATLTVTKDVVLASGSALSLSTGLSVGGNWTNNGGTFTPGTNGVTFNGSSTQTIGGTGSTTFYNLTTSATAAVTVSAATTVNNQLALNSKVTLSSAALTIGSAGLAISGTSSSNYIVATGSGILQKTFGSAGSYTYPIGDASNFTPIAATLAASSFGGTVGFTTTNSKNPQDASVTDYLNRYWTMTTSGLTSPSVSGTATFIPADIVGTAANVYSAVNNANTSSGWALGSAITSPTLAFSGVTTSGATFGGVNGVPPVVTSLVPSTTMINLSKVGTNTFSLTINFSKGMNQSISPAITFPTSGEDPSAVITFSSGSWASSTQYVANYNVVSNSAKMSNIDVNIASAKDAMTNALMTSATTTNVFSYDMVTPTVTIGVNKTSLKDSDVGSTILFTLTFSEAMTSTIAPTISFPVESNGGAIAFASGTWSSSTVYAATFNITTDINNDIPNIDVAASGAQNLDGNSIALTTNANLFNIFMLNPVLSPLTIASNNSNSSSVAKSGDVITLSFTSSKTLGSLPTATIDGRAASVSLVSGLQYNATLTMNGTDVEGTIPFTINAVDANGNTTSATSTTNGSSVTYDRTAPTNQNTVFTGAPTTIGGHAVTIVASALASDKIWFAPSGLTLEGSFIAGATMTKASSGSATSILAPATAGSYKLYVIDLAGNVSSASGVALSVNNTPTLTNIEATTQTYTEKGAAASITGTLVVDAATTNMSGATIQISGNYSSGNDQLNYTTANGITGTWTPATGVLSLSGTATISQYQTAIRSITFSNTSSNPSTLARTISFQVTDASSVSSNTVTRTLNVVAVNDAPSFTTSPTTTVTATNLYVYDMNATDPDNTLAFANFSAATPLPSWLAITNAGTGLARLSGTPPAGTSGPFSISLQCSDGSGGITPQNFTLTVTGAVVVDAGGSGNYTTIQAAVNASANGSKIIINPGTYKENVVLAGRTLDFAGTNMTTCIVDGNCAGSVFQITGSSVVTFTNLTIKNGCGTLAVQADPHGPEGYYGGGFYIYGSSVTMTNLSITGNQAPINAYIGGSGGGIYAGQGSNVSLVGVSVTGNTAQLYRGGGICTDKATLSLDAASSVTGNTGCNYGAGICAWSSTLTITSGANISGNTNTGSNTSFGSQVFYLNSSSAITYPGGSGSNSQYYHIP